MAAPTTPMRHPASHKVAFADLPARKNLAGAVGPRNLAATAPPTMLASGGKAVIPAHSTAFTRSVNSSHSSGIISSGNMGRGMDGPPGARAAWGSENLDTRKGGPIPASRVGSAGKSAPAPGKALSAYQQAMSASTRSLPTEDAQPHGKAGRLPPHPYSTHAKSAGPTVPPSALLDDKLPPKVKVPPPKLPASPMSVTELSSAMWAERVRPPPSPVRLEPLADRLHVSPRELPSFVQQMLEDDSGRFKDVVDLEQHAMQSGFTVTNATVQELFQSRPNLKAVSFRNAVAVTDAGLWAVARECTSLTSLNMSGIPGITHVGLRSITLRCQNLEKLDLSYCSGMHDLALRVLAANSWGLNALNLEGCEGFSDPGISELVQCCQRLEVVNVSRIPNLTDSAVENLARHCTNLVSLNVSNCRWLKDGGVSAIAQCSSKLKHLVAESMIGMSGAVCVSLAKHAKSLQYLSLADCKGIGGADVAAVLRGCTSLTTLNLRKCPNIKTPFFAALDKYGGQLLELNLGSMSSVTDTHVQHIAQGCGALRVLDVRGCKRLGEEGVRTLVLGCSRLTSLKVDDCPQISDPFVSSLVRELPFVQAGVDWRGLAPLADADQRIMLTELRRIQTAAAKHVQRLWRGGAARRAVKKLILVMRANQAAGNIQRVIRGHIGRQKAHRRRRGVRMQEAALIIQCVWRGHKGRVKARRRRRLLAIRASQDRASIMIQALWRGHVARKLYQQMQVEVFRARQAASKAHSRRIQAAKTIQGAWKVYKSKVFLKALRRALAEARQNQSKQNAAARIIQRMMRGHADRCIVRRMRAAMAYEALRQFSAVKIQSLFRMIHGRAVVQRRREEVRAATRLKAARLIQRVWRGHRGRHVSAVMRSFEQLRKLEAAAVIRIQNKWRMYRARGLYESLMAAREAERRRTAAAVRIQSTFRGMQARATREVLVALVETEGVAKPLREQIQQMEQQRQGILTDFKQFKTRVEEAEKMLSEWIAELEELQTITAKTYDSAKISGTMQRYKTSFLRKALRTHIVDVQNRVVVMKEKMTKLAGELRDVDRLLRAKRRELRPFEDDVIVKARVRRREKLRDDVKRRRWAASKIQAMARAVRVRKAVHAGRNNWVELWDHVSSTVYFFNTRTNQSSWSRPLEFELYGAAESQPTASGWIKHRDNDLGAEYYYNVYSGQYQWDIPADYYSEPSLSNTAAGSTAYDASWLAAQDVQQLTDRSARRRMLGDWQEWVDPESGCTYYTNTVTGEARWSLSPRTLAGEASSDGGGHLPAAPDREPPSNAAHALSKERPAHYGREWWDHQDKEALSARAQTTGRFGDWQELLDEASGIKYYYNYSTGDSSWEVPASIAMAVRLRDERANANENEEFGRQWLAKQEVSALVARSSSRRQINDWQELTDSDTGLSYYYNATTGVAQWEKPEEVGAYDQTVEEFALIKDEEFDEEATQLLATEQFGSARKEMPGWVPPAPIKDAAEDDEELLKIIEHQKAERRGTGGRAPPPMDVRPVSGKHNMVWPDMDMLPVALRKKISTVDETYEEYPERAAHVAFLRKQLRQREWLMASGAADQMIVLQQKARNSAARNQARAEAKRRAMILKAEQAAREVRERMEAADRELTAAEEARKAAEEEAKREAEIAARREAKLKAKAEREAREAAEAAKKAEEEAAARSAEFARQEREQDGMQRADEESQRAHIYLERMRAEELSRRAQAKAAAERAEAESARAKARQQATENALLAAQLDALKAQLRAAQDSGAPAAEAAPAPAVNESPWVAVDDGEGNVYYFNTVTQESTWEAPLDMYMPAAQAPAPAPAAPEPVVPDVAVTNVWDEVKDADGNLFYFNSATNETAWEVPPGGVLRGADSHAATSTVSGSPSKVSRSGHPLASDWEMVDDGQGGVYYYNVVTGMSQWETPREFL